MKGRKEGIKERKETKKERKQERNLCRYGLGWQQSLKACMQRELKLVYRDRFNLYSRTFQITYLAFLSATLFIKPGYDSVAQGQLFLLEIFFASLVSIFAGFGKVSSSLLGKLAFISCMHKVSPGMMLYDSPLHLLFWCCVGLCMQRLEAAILLLLLSALV